MGEQWEGVRLELIEKLMMAKRIAALKRESDEAATRLVPFATRVHIAALERSAETIAARDATIAEQAAEIERLTVAAEKAWPMIHPESHKARRVLREALDADQRYDFGPTPADEPKA